MRELKFRAWLKNYNCYAEVLGFDWGRLIVHLQRGELVEHRLHVPLEDCILEQYICLEDKNGKEIYEGDIVKFDDVDKDAEVSKPAEVIMEYGAFLTKCADGELYILEDGTPAVLGLIRNELYQVIGNIHENKELLEEE